MIETEFYTVSDMQKLLSCCARTVYNFIEKGKLTRVYVGGLPRITAESYRALKAEATETTDRAA